MDEAVRETAEAFGEAVALVKAHLVGRDRVADSNVVQAVDDAERVFLGMGAIPPPYDPETLCLLLENSNSLRQNIDAYVTNIDAFGHRFESIVDLDASDADQRIANALYIERLKLKEDPRRRDDPAVRSLEPMPTSEEVAAKKREVADLMRMEKSRLENFFEYCCVDSSFVTLRRRTRLDIELLGNGYWEVLRNGAGELVQFVYVPGFTVRLFPLDPELIRDVQPFVQVGADREGNQVLFYEQGGRRRAVARVDEPAVGERDEVGRYSRALSPGQLEAAGVAVPPLHGRCRSTIVAV